MKRFLFTNVWRYFLILVGIGTVASFSIGDYWEDSSSSEEDDNDIYSFFEDDQSKEFKDAEEKERKLTTSGNLESNPGERRCNETEEVEDYVDILEYTLSLLGINEFVDQVINFLDIFDFLNESEEEIDSNDNVTHGTNSSSTTFLPVNETTTEMLNVSDISMTTVKPSGGISGTILANRTNNATTKKPRLQNSDRTK